MNDRNRPLNTCFIITSMHVGGAETLLTNLIEQTDRSKINPHLVCLKEPGELGHRLSSSIPTYHSLTKSKFDLRVFSSLARIFRDHQIDAVVTVGAGDKMFWGRLAAKWSGVRVIACALHSTGWPDEIGFANRRLTSITDGFIAVADAHREYLCNVEKLPKEKIFTIANGIDTRRFAPNHDDRHSIRTELNIAKNAPVIGIVAALRPEKDHLLFLDVAQELLKRTPAAKFLIIGEGAERRNIEQAINDKGLGDAVCMLGSRSDTQRYLAAMDVFVLTSKNEAKPVSILEALACEVPAVAPDVGSVHESVIEGETGFLIRTRIASDYASAIERIIGDTQLRQSMGSAGRQLVCQHSSLDSMVNGYESLLWRLKDRREAQRGIFNSLQNLVPNFRKRTSQGA
jgi:glycosyltransferase involved in cell wall biosynthesis